MKPKAVNFHNGRADGQGHVTLESKNSTKYKQYLDLLLRWICHAPQTCFLILYINFFGNHLLLGITFEVWIILVDKCRCTIYLMLEFHKISNCCNFFCCTIAFYICVLPSFRHSSKFETDMDSTPCFFQRGAGARWKTTWKPGEGQWSRWQGNWWTHLA